jgi:hypothetical protein
VRPQTPVEDAELVVVDPRRDPGCREYVDGLGELVLVVGGVGHVLGKLGAANRTEAVARARELNLL